MDILINYLDKFGPELLVIQFGFLIILSTLFLWLWFSNRRKYHNLKHVIPANVVKNYLDSIIQNSTALKSSLFRGGGLDLDNVPSVMPLGQLGGGENVAVSGAPSAHVLEELAEKKAIIASLEAQLLSAKTAGTEFEGKAKKNHKDLSVALEKIAELEAQLENGSVSAPVSEHDDSRLQEELVAVTKERDELLERLREFEVIADDLANLKRLQQENEQLKKSLGASPEVNPQKEEALQAEVSELLEQVSEAVAETSGGDMSSLDEFLSEGEMTAEEKEMLAAMNESAPQEEAEEKKEEKPLANDDLLSEFEKMLG